MNRSAGGRTKLLFAAHDDIIALPFPFVKRIYLLQFSFSQLHKNHSENRELLGILKEEK